MEIKDFSGIERTIKEIITSAKETTNKFSAMTAETLLFEGKFGNLGTKWDDCKQPYDLGEQIQQSMTMLVTCYAIGKWFSEKYQYPFKVSPAGKNGQDISDKQGQMTCEIFAAKKSTNNQKLWHDLNALAIKEGPSKKFVFCCSPDEIKILKGEKHSSQKFNFLFNKVKCSNVPENKFREITVEISGEDKSKKKSYEKQSISIIHVTPCIVHQWVRNLSLSGL